MDAPKMSHALHLALVSSLLKRGASLDRVSSLLTVLGLFCSLAPLFGLEIHSGLALGGLLLVLLGISEKYWALRVAIDADLLTALASRKDVELAGSELDNALQQLGLAPDNLPERSILSRSQGALRLLRYQALCLGGQVSLLLAGALVASWLTFYS